MDKSGKMNLSQINVNSTKSNETKHFEFIESREVDSCHKFKKNFTNSQLHEVHFDRCPYTGISSGQGEFRNNKIDYHAHKLQEIGEFYKGYNAKLEDMGNLRMKEGNYLEGNVNSGVHN